MDLERQPLFSEAPPMLYRDGAWNGDFYQGDPELETWYAYEGRHRTPERRLTLARIWNALTGM